MRKKRLAISVFACVMLPVVVFSAERSDATSRRSVAEIGRALDGAQAILDEYGTISISAPILNFARSNEFLFRLTNGALFYFNEAKTNIQGKAASSEQRFQSFLMSAKAEVDPTAAGAYMAAAQNYTRDLAAYHLRQATLRQAADLQLQAALAQAATNTDPAASNQAVVAALRAHAANLYPGDQPPVFPQASSVNSNSPAAPSSFTNLLTDTNYGRLAAMQGFLGLLTNMPSGLSTPNRSALLTAAGDNAVESFFRALGDSALAKGFVNSEIYFGLTTVSINPGWRTIAGGWAGEANVTLELEFKEARRGTVIQVLNTPFWPAEVRAGVARDYGYAYRDASKLRLIGVEATRADEIVAATAVHPDLNSIPYSLRMKTIHKPVQVMIVSPMIESETFDLASSYRSQTEIALSLAAALNYPGAKGAAEAFRKYAKSLQSDFASRTPVPMVNAYSGQEGAFGFQIGPRPQALTNPGNRKSGPGNVLNRQTFPALIIVSMSRGDIEPRLIVDDRDYRFRVNEPYIVLRQSHRWVPLSSRRTLSERSRIEAADKLEKAVTQISDLKWKTTFGMSARSGLSDALRERILRFERELIGTINYITLPLDRLDVETSRQAEITDVTPGIVRVGSDGKESSETVFLIRGNNLDLAGQEISTLYTNTSAPKILSQSASGLVVSAVLTNSNHPIVFVLKTKAGPSGSTTTYSPPVAVEQIK